MKFSRKDTATIMDGMVIRYKCGDFEINASRNGVSTNGFMPMIEHQGDLEVVFEYMRRAFRQYVQLRPNAHSLYNRVDPFPEEVFESVSTENETELSSP